MFSQSKNQISIANNYESTSFSKWSIVTQELVEKSLDSELQAECPDIQWHFIGNCQTNKVDIWNKQQDYHQQGGYLLVSYIFFARK